jgi:GNAT superfamily N-acetyltransferase
MDIRRFTPGDTVTLPEVVDLRNAAAKVDAPFEHPLTVHQYAGMLRHGWDGEVPEPYAAWDGGRLVGVLELHTSEWDNTHLAWLDLLVHPDLRGAGRGTELLGFARKRAVALGRSSLGSFGWDIASTRRFADRHAFPVKGTAIKRRQDLAHVDRVGLARLYEEALGAAHGYELLRIAGTTPSHMLEAVAEMTAAINDAPTDDLDIEDEVFPAERVAAYEAAQVARGHRLYRVVARHRETGGLAGHTVVAVYGERPWLGDQHDTSVVGRHRGHRLGVLVKAEMLRWLEHAEPELRTIDTWNMESNDHMIGVNELLGYEVLGRELQLQRDA